MTKDQKKLDDTEEGNTRRNGKKQEQRGRNRKKQKNHKVTVKKTGRNRKK